MLDAAELQPVPPQRLSCFAREALELLAGQPAAAEIVLGGGVALAHYLDYRETYDLHAWWATAPSPAATAIMDDVVQELARRHGLSFASRSWGATLSFELIDGSRKVFSLQIAPRDRYVDETREAAWHPVKLETLSDNIASKMIALVERAAPRDFRDIHALCAASIVTPEDCWRLYEAKQPSQDRRAAAAKILHALTRLELQCPLDTPQKDGDRQTAAEVFRSHREAFCVDQLREGLAVPFITTRSQPQPLDHTVYPEMPSPPEDLLTLAAKADYLQRVCAAFDFGIFPEPADWNRFAEWKAVFDACPLPDSPAYHVFRAWYGWDPVPRGTCGLDAAWRIQDRREGREDPCEHTV